MHIDTMDESIRLNNDAICLLLQSSDKSRMHDAIELLTRSLKSLKMLLMGLEPSESKDDASSNDRGTEQLEIRVAFTEDDSIFHGSTHAESNYVFQRMFRLVPNVDSSVPSAIRISIACVIFNLALLHQHLAATLMPGAQRESILEKSVRLYHSSSQMVRSSTKTTKRTSADSFDDVVFLLKVGSLNNLAQILYERDEYEQAGDRLDIVESILCDHGLFETKCYFTTQEFEGILANVMLLKPPIVAVAA